MALLGVMFSVGRSEQASLGGDALQDHDPFALYAADDGALKWEDMSAAEQAETTATRDWAEHDDVEVHNAFSAAVATTESLRALQEAQNSSGLQGIESLGVVP